VQYGQTTRDNAIAVEAQAEGEIRQLAKSGEQF
jgi:hypothetical protein